MPYVQFSYYSEAYDSHFSGYFNISSSRGQRSIISNNSRITPATYYYNNVTGKFYVFTIRGDTTVSNSNLSGNIDFVNADVVDSNLSMKSGPYRSHVSYKAHNQNLSGCYGSMSILGDENVTAKCNHLTRIDRFIEIPIESRTRTADDKDYGDASYSDLN